jgi:hypothetical protein
LDAVAAISFAKGPQPPIVNVGRDNQKTNDEEPCGDSCLFTIEVKGIALQEQEREFVGVVEKPCFVIELWKKTHTKRGKEERRKTRRKIPCLGGR